MDVVEVQSAYGANEMHKKRMYQIELRQLQALDGAYEDDLAHGKSVGGKSISQEMRKSAVLDQLSALGALNGKDSGSVIDLDEYRRLQEKQERINLKKALYERKKINDET